MPVRRSIVGIDGPDALEHALQAAQYLADEGLATAAYLALALGKPLLLEGAPGWARPRPPRPFRRCLGATSFGCNVTKASTPPPLSTSGTIPVRCWPSVKLARITSTSTHSAELAVEEIERLAPDRRFVQVLLLAMTELPLGRRQNWPIYKAAEAHGLPIGIHAGSSFRHPPSALGWPSYYLEDYVSQAQGFQAALNSLVTEGVFVKFPGLKVVLIESGVTWLPASLWRLDKTWRGVRAETPWLEEQPTETVRRHVRLTMQPFDAPPTEQQLQILLEQLGSDRMLLFASDYPHWHFDGDDALPSGLSTELIQKICIENPLETYPRLKEMT